jgi:GT2 family glycosyltransferase
MICSILIPIYNRIAVTRQGLSSLYDGLERYTRSGAGNICRFEVVVIDDGSTDGSAEWIAANYPSIHICRGDGNLWWSGAINMGAEYAIGQLNSDYLLLWNDDIMAADDYFIRAADVLASPPANTVFGSKIVVKENPAKTWSVGGFFDRIWGRYGLHTDAGESPDGWFECDWQPGMGTFVPVDLIRRHNLRWDSVVFPQYHGDSDFTLRCKSKGIAVKTRLDLLIYNSSATSGLGKINNMNKLWLSLVSMRSNYNLRKRLLFYRRHGVIPLSYVGLGKMYFMYFGSFFKRTYVMPLLAPNTA